MTRDTRRQISMDDLIRADAIKRSESDVGRQQKKEYQHLFYTARVRRALHELYLAIDGGKPRPHLVRLFSVLRASINE